MKISVIRETDPAERRIPLLPASVGKLVKLGAEIAIESRLGASINISDEEYIKEGASVDTPLRCGIYC